MVRAFVLLCTRLSFCWSWDAIGIRGSTVSLEFYLASIKFTIGFAMAKNILMVPIHLDALYVPGSGELSVIEPMADFTRLPYFDGKQDVNPDVANNQ